MHRDNYESISSQLGNLRVEPDKTFVREFLKQLEEKLRTWSPIIRKKFDLDEIDRSRILNLDIPGLVEELGLNNEKTIPQSRPKKSKTEEIEEESYYSYDYEDDEDDINPNPTWQDLNPDDLSYPVWLAKVGLPRFFPFPEEILYKVAASICLINSAALPGMLRSVSLQAELPLVIAYGLPNVGKTTFCNWLGYHYLSDPGLADDWSPYQIVKDDTSYKGLRDALDRACRYKDSLREGCVHIDDFEPRMLLSDGLWGKSRGIFIAVQRSQATSRVSVNGSKSETQAEFIYWVLKLLSTNNHPKELFSALPKMERRCLILPFEKLSTEDNLGNYDWSCVRKEYVSLWNKTDRDAIFWKLLLRPLLKKPFSEFRLPQDLVARSITVMAVGTFAGIWSSLEEAEDHMILYWEYIKERTQEGYQDFLILALESFVENAELSTKTGVSKLDGKRKRVCTITLRDLTEKCGQSVNKEKEKDRIIQFMLFKGYTAINPVLGGIHTPSFIKELE